MTLQSLAFVLFPALTLLAQPAEDIKTHTETIRSASHTFQIDVGGTIDPENLEIIIDNQGDVPVKNPRITVNGKYNWYTLAGLVEEILRGPEPTKKRSWPSSTSSPSRVTGGVFPKTRPA